MLVRKVFICENVHPGRSILVDDDYPYEDEKICPICGIEYASIRTLSLNDKAVIRIENGVHQSDRVKKCYGEKTYYLVVTDFYGKEYGRAAHAVTWTQLIRHLELLREMTIEEAVRYLRREKLTV